MLSQNQVKHITALRVKKYREEYGQFIAEGHKLVMDLLDSGFKIAGIYASADWIVNNLSTVRSKDIPLFETLPNEMQRISSLSTPSPVLAVLNIPIDVLSAHRHISTLSHQHIITSAHQHISILSHQHITTLILALDDIRDPGNLGTIIRIADWFGIGAMLCSENCVDVYNPKVVQATMGSIARVKIIRCNLAEAIAALISANRSSDTSLPSSSGMQPIPMVHAELMQPGVRAPSKDHIDFPVYGALLEGESIFSQTLTDHGIIIIGNESRGISPDLIPLITRKIFIPSFGNASVGKAESLNASIAAAIICAEFRRNNSMEG